MVCNRLISNHWKSEPLFFQTLETIPCKVWFMGSQFPAIGSICVHRCPSADNCCRSRFGRFFLKNKKHFLSSFRRRSSSYGGTRRSNPWKCSCGARTPCAFWACSESPLHLSRSFTCWTTPSSLFASQIMRRVARARSESSNHWKLCALVPDAYVP